ncbi:MAG: MotE family protein [Hyphomicrobium sp.]|uniref:MotE family protein n=1 Tax=Hyphomicrobium sp. TaxID=82 RepID=UPI0039E217AA
MKPGIISWTRAAALLDISGVVAIVLAALVLGTSPSFADSLMKPMVGPPVDRSARSLELRQTAGASEPIAYSFRIAVDDSKPEKSDGKDPDALPLPPTVKPELSPAQQYCSSVIDTTSAAQIAQQTRDLQKAQKDIDDRISLLTAKAEVLKNWMKLREDFAARATDSLVQIYSRMKPDSAAAQLAVMEEMTSSAIISKLSPKVASPILAEMDVAKAARLSAIISGAGELAMQRERKADAQQ